jgi:DNA-binding MarR family transcriptional regulator
MRRLRDEYLGAIDDLLREIIGSFLRPPAPPPARDMNLTLGQMDCLRTIGELGEPTMSEVAGALRLHPSTVTVLVEGLVAHGLVKRRPDPKDRRVVRVAETARGRWVEASGRAPARVLYRAKDATPDD